MASITSIIAVLVSSLLAQYIAKDEAKSAIQLTQFRNEVQSELVGYRYFQTLLNATTTKNQLIVFKDDSTEFSKRNYYDMLQEIRKSIGALSVYPELRSSKETFRIATILNAIMVELNGERDGPMGYMIVKMCELYFNESEGLWKDTWVDLTDSESHLRASAKNLCKAIEGIKKK